jgi:alkylation response protein AidB-like acyl-CoA dehydrogenase
MLQPATSAPSVTRQDMLDRARALAPRFAERAAAAEEARRIPPESVKEMLDAGLARMLLPAQQGRCVARLVRRADHPPRPYGRAVFRGSAE